MSRGRRSLLILGGVGAISAALGAFVGALVSQSRSGAGALLASSFPDTTGRVRRLSEWQGRPILCNFWATWCEPCREEMPLLDAAQARYGSNRLQIVGIAIDNDANVADFVSKNKFSFPLLVGEFAAVELMRELGNGEGALPFTVLVDASGRLRKRKLGAYSDQALRADLEQLVR